jgi:alkylhydroperoxidase/carboxymuconolactone decarboxylase family protein YurZ
MKRAGPTTGTPEELRGAVAIIRTHDEPLYKRWCDAMEAATQPVEIDGRDRALLRLALDISVHTPSDFLAPDVEEAFNAGSNVTEVIEMFMYIANLESGMHGIHDGFEALEMILRDREQNDMAIPVTGEGLGPEDMKPEAPWPEPPVFPMHSPNPRPQITILRRYHSELLGHFDAWNKALFSTRKELTRRLQELSLTAVDVGIVYPSPYLDHHMHAAFEIGSTAQELLETVIFSSAVVYGARARNLAYNAEGAFLSLHHGVTALERVIAEREGAGLWAPRNRNSPREGRAALTL